MQVITRIFLLVFITIGMLRANAQTYIPGTTYYGANDFIEYRAGNLPVIISAPHGGYLEPDTIPDRNCPGCVYVKDAYTQELSEELFESIHALTGCYPHVIINKLHRIKLDANRNITEAADGDPLAEQAWYEFHAFIDSAASKITSDYGAGFYVDLHGHGHTIQRLELGYLLYSDELREPDSILNTPLFTGYSSIQHLAGSNLNGYSHAELLRGPYALGTYLGDKGYPSVPSQAIPWPDSLDPYFSGGYNTAEHSSYSGGVIDGVQIECHSDVRFDSVARRQFADSLALSLVQYIDKHILAGFMTSFCLPLSAEDSRISEEIVYPQPACGVVYLPSVLQEQPLVVYDLSGMAVLRKKGGSGETLDVSGLRDGLYLLTTNGGTFVRRLWVQCK